MPGTNYPTSLDDSTSLRTVTDSVDDVLAIDQNYPRDAIVAVETKLGYGADTPTNGDVLIGNTTAGTSQWRPLTTADVAASTDKNYVTDAQAIVIGNTSGTNTGDQTLPVKATGTELDTGTDDAKFATAKALKDSHNVPSVAPSTSGNYMVSNGTDWTSSSFPTNFDLVSGLGSDHTVSGLRIVLTANEAQAFGDVCYINSSGYAQLVDASAIASGIALVMCADASISATASGNYLLLGTARDDTWSWTVGGLVYITITGTTGNTLSQTAPTATDEVVLPVGVATTSHIMVFKPGLTAVELV